MKTWKKMTIPPLVIFILSSCLLQQAVAGVIIRVVNSIDAGKDVLASSLITSNPSAPPMDKLMETPDQIPLVPRVSTGFGLFFEDSNGVPVKVTSCVIEDALYEYYRILPTGAKSEVFYNQPMSFWRHESSPQGGGALFMTNGDATPISPASGDFRNVTVVNVGAIFITKKAYLHTVSPPYYRLPVNGERHVYQFKVKLKYTYAGVTTSKTLNFTDLMTSFSVTDKLPQVKRLEVTPEKLVRCVEGEGEFLDSFNLQYASTLGQPWETVGIQPTTFIQSNQYWCHWNLLGDPAARVQSQPCGFFRFAQNPRYYPWGQGGGSG